MALKNYTTKIDPNESMGEIMGALAKAGARKVMVDYDDHGIASGITFGLNMEPVTGQICFRAGSRPDSDFMKCDVHCEVGEGNPEWGAEPHKIYYVLKILAIKEVTRC